MKQKKVLILSLGRNNALPGYAKSIYSHLNQEDFDVMLSRQTLTPYAGKNKIEIDTYSNGKEFSLRTLVYLPWVFFSLVPRMYKEYNVLYLPYMHFWDLPFILFFKLLGRPVILTVHDGVLHKGEDGFFARVQNRMELRMADELIFLTNYVKEAVYGLYRFKKPFYVVPHGLIGEDFIKPVNRTAPGKTLLFLGRISPYKGVELLIETVAGMENVSRLIIAGKSIYNIQYLQNPRIEVHDKYLSEEEIAQYIAAADVLVLPYLEASQSGVIALGITAAIPMVCTNVGGFHEQLGPNEAVFVNPDKASLKEGISTLLNNNTLYQDIVRRLEAKRQTLSWAVIAKQVAEIIM